jgi:hypothetical protein
VFIRAAAKTPGISGLASFGTPCAFALIVLIITASKVSVKKSMKRKSRIAIGFGLALAASFSQASVIYTVSNINEYTTAQAGTTTVNFNDGTCGAYVSCVGDGALVAGSVSGKYATPLGISDLYLSIPFDQSSGSATFLTPGSYDYFGLYWGSVDTYNSIAFYSGGSLVGGFSGGDISPPLVANGNQTEWSSNRYVNFFFTGGDTFDRIVITSTNYAFESDNHAFGNVGSATTTSVPEPAMLSLFAIGLIGVGFAARRKQANQ